MVVTWLAWCEKVTNSHALLGSGRRPKTGLRSASTPELLVQATQRSTFGDRAFPVAATRLWNALPHDVTSATSVSSFRRQLKTFLFRHSYGSSPISHWQQLSLFLDFVTWSRFAHTTLISASWWWWWWWWWYWHCEWVLLTCAASKEEEGDEEEEESVGDAWVSAASLQSDRDRQLRATVDTCTVLPPRDSTLSSLCRCSLF